MTKNSNRIPAQKGEWIDRSEQISFTFNKKRYVGYAGDNIASALAANGQWILSRSFKYRRPRGILTMAGQDANTLIQLKNEPNTLADKFEITEGLVADGQNYDFSLENDAGAIVGLGSKFMPVGFYYKTFFRPKGAWKFWEPIIRNRAGLGKVDLKTPHDYYDKAYGWYDVVIVGAGPAGMAAAITAANAGCKVLLVDENPHLGGSLCFGRFDADGKIADQHREALTSTVNANANIEVMCSAMCNGWFEDNWLPIYKDNRLYKIRARHVVLATGSIEQPIIFRNNDLPGIMQASAAQRLIRKFGVRPGKRAVIATANDDGYATALSLAETGCEVAAILDLRNDAQETPLSQAVRDHGIDIHQGHAPYEAMATSGHKHVKGVRAAKIIGRGKVEQNTFGIDCDLLCMAPGFTPTHQLLSHAGGTTGYSNTSHMFEVRNVPDGLSIAGSVAGTYQLDAVIAKGQYAGWQAANAVGANGGEAPKLPEDQAANQSFPWPIFPHPKGKEFIDFDEDLQIKDIENACREGYDHIELVKRYSTVGMGPSQGRHSALNSVRISASMTGQDIEEVGRTTSRPPFAGEKFAALAGRSFEPVRHTPMHHRHLEAGAQMMPAGLWMRPAYYGPKSERTSCIEKEALNVRNNVGLVDVSTLGGLEIRGPDAAEFINRMYTFAYLKQPLMRSRYALMTDETGVIVDDGVACRFHEEHFYVSATTGGVDSVYRNMLRWNAMWRLKVDVTNVSAAYAGVNLAGPKSRDVLARLCSDVDLSPEAFPFVEARLGAVAGIPARLIRVGFVGELGYEIHVPASQGEALWDAIMEAGKPESIQPFGVEAQRMLRLEKGHIIVNQDTDGLTNPYEADMGWAISTKKPYYVGNRAVKIQNENGISRKLVGFTITGANPQVPEECRLTLRDDEITGYVTSAVHSPTLGKIIGLAYVSPDQSEPGTQFDIKLEKGTRITGEVVPLPFYDPDGKRQEL